MGQNSSYLPTLKTNTLVRTNSVEPDPTSQVRSHLITESLDVTLTSFVVKPDFEQKLKGHVQFW